MQLIAEPEPTIDIEMNMSSVENIQINKNDDNKIVSADIEDLNDKKCNGNKDMSDVKKNSNSEERKQVIRDIYEAMTKTPIDIDNDKEESSNVETKSSHETQNAMPEESQKNGSDENDVNDLETVESDVMNIGEPKDISEDDYLEDDIISINQEPFTPILIPETQPIDTVSENDEEYAKNDIEHLTTVEDTLEVLKDESETLQVEKIPTIDDDVVEILEETDNSPVQCIAATEPQTRIEKDVMDIIESEKQSPIQVDQSSQPPVQIKEDQLETIEEPFNSAIESENLVEPVLKENDKIEIVDEPESTHVQCENESELKQSTTDNDKTETAVAVEPSVSDETILQSPIEESKQDDVELIEEGKDTNNESNILESPIEESKHDIEIIEDNIEPNTSCANKTVENQDVMEVIDETEENAVPLDTIIKDTTESTVQCEDTPDLATHEKTEGEEPKKHAQDESESSLPTEVAETNNLTEHTENTISHLDNSLKIIETSNSESEVKEPNTDDTPVVVKDDSMDVEEIVKDTGNTTESVNSPIELKDDMDVEDDVVEKTNSNKNDCIEVKDSVPVNTVPAGIIDKPPVCKLSNTLDILSDDEEELLKDDSPNGETPKTESPKPESSTETKVDNKQCINIDDDDDIMLIDEDTNKTVTDAPVETSINKEIVDKPEKNTDSETDGKTIEETDDLFETSDKKEKSPPPVVAAEDLNVDIGIKEKTPEPKIDKSEPLPLIPDNFVKTAKNKLSNMTRDELEEFCILKIVESIVDRSSLSEIKNKLKSMSQGLDEHRKKAMMLTKQNRDLQVVLKSVQEEQKKAMSHMPITPLKITRSVGMQVYMEKTAPRKKGPPPNTNNRTPNNAQNKNNVTPGTRPQKQINQPIPVPRLVPANSPASKTPTTIQQINQMNTPTKNMNQPPNGIIKTPPLVKAEKRPHNKMASSSVTVDLTDDEPPTKMSGGARLAPAPVRLVPPQNLMGPQRQAFGPNVNSPRKVYIPISGPQNQALRPGQTIMLKTVPAAGIRQRCPTPQVTRVEPNPVRMSRVAARHPAPLPFAMKQYQPPNWKTLPPAPDLKLSKVENGIVISWKIEGIPEDSYEEIASYQLYAYQETSQPPSTTLWKKIGDVKALPLPMACTLTQFMAGFKYYFAVRAVDIRSRLGPFSLPGSILLLSKNI